MNFRLLSQYHADIKKLIKISLPILLAQIAQNSMGLADTIMAGRVSSTDMAAISIGASIWMPLMFFGQGLLLALPPTISYLNGSGQHCTSSSPRHLACVRREYSFRFTDLFL